MTKCALRPSLDFDPKLRFQYSWDQFRLSKRKEDFSILHFLLSLCNPSKLLWDRECNGSSNRFRKAHFMLNPCTASTNQYSPHIVSFTARASGSSKVPICLPTFQNRQLTWYLCPQSPTSFWDSQLPGERLPSSHSSEAPMYLTFFTDSTTLNLTAPRLYNIWRL